MPPTAKRRITLGPGTLSSGQLEEGPPTETSMRAPTASEKLWDKLGPVRDALAFLFGENEIEQAQNFLAPSPLAIFAPMTRQSHRAYDAIRKINPDVERNMLRDFKYLPEEDPGGAAGKYMFEDPETGEKLMYKFGSQADVESGLSGIVHTAEHIAGVKKKSAPSLRVNMVKTRPDEPNLLVDYMGKPYNTVGSLQRFLPGVTDFFKFQQNQAMRNMRRAGSSPRGRRGHFGVPRQSAEDVMRTGPVEFLAGLTDRKPANYVIGPDKKLIPVDMGLGLYTPDPYVDLRLPGESDYSYFAQRDADIPFLRDTFRDAARRIVKQGSEPYRPFFPLFENSYYAPQGAKNAIEHNLNLLAEPGHVDDMFTSLVAKAFARNNNIYSGSW